MSHRQVDEGAANPGAPLPPMSLARAISRAKAARIWHRSTSMIWPARASQTTVPGRPGRSASLCARSPPIGRAVSDASALASPLKRPLVSPFSSRKKRAHVPGAADFRAWFCAFSARLMRRA
eukprot:853954-Pyramimonas_sp.AAC.2